jgi:hypothetical protein
MKKLGGTNTLAYFVLPSVTKKVFRALFTTANILNFFTFSTNSLAKHNNVKLFSAMSNICDSSQSLSQLENRKGQTL